MGLLCGRLFPAVEECLEFIQALERLFPALLIDAIHLFRVMGGAAHVEGFGRSEYKGFSLSFLLYFVYSVQFSCSVMSDSL